MSAIMALILAQLIRSLTGDYPLGPFAHISWRAVFRDTPSVRTQLIQGRTYYTFLPGADVSWGTPSFLSMSAGPVGARHTWLAAIPMDSGGSGQAFTIAIFRADGNSVRYVDSVSGSDRMGAQIYGGTLHVTMPARTDADRSGDCCYEHIRVLDYTFDGNRLRKLSAAIVHTRSYFASHVPQNYIAGTISRTWWSEGHRYATVHGAFSGTFAVTTTAVLTNLTLNEKLLLVCRFAPVEGAEAHEWTIIDAYPYKGGLE